MRNNIVLAVIAALMMLTGSAKAELSVTETLSKVPGVNQGIGYSVIDSRINYLTTIDLVSWKGVSLEAGYSGRAKSTGDKLVAVVSYDLFNAKKAGITLPVLDLIDVRIGAYAGFGRIQIGSESVRDGGNEFDAGLSATALKLKF
jgi:hypothetical protein